MTKTDFSDDPRFKRALTCNIHSEVSFAIDEECPVCIDNESEDVIQPYIEYIEHLEMMNKRLKNRIHKRSDV